MTDVFMFLMIKDIFSLVILNVNVLGFCKLVKVKDVNIVGT